VDLARELITAAQLLLAVSLTKQTKPIEGKNEDKERRIKVQASRNTMLSIAHF
jgi:hypothetical protein